MPNGVLTDIQFIHFWEAEAKEVWERVAVSHGFTEAKKIVGLNPQDYHRQAALSVLRYGGIAYTGQVAEIVRYAEQWQKENPYTEECPEDDKAFMDMLYERQLAGY